MPANKIKLEICGSNYVIATTDTEEYVLSLAEKLDSDMTQMLASNPTASVTTAAVITALGYLDELKKSTSGADNMRAQIKDYLEDAPPRPSWLPRRPAARWSACAARSAI